MAAGDEGDAHGDFAVGDVDAGGAVGDPVGIGYGEKRCCLNRSDWDESRCCWPAMTLGLLRWWAYADAKSGLCWAARANCALSSIGLKPEARCW